MAGKNTSKTQHASSIGCIVDSYKLTAQQLADLSFILGRDIDSDMIYVIEDVITNYTFILKDRASADITSQDIKRTLTAMSTMNESQALDAFQNCDSYTEGNIQRVISTGERGKRFFFESSGIESSRKA